MRPLALVTGASAGLGREFAMQLAAKRVDVVLVARRRDRLEELAADIRSMGVDAEVLVADLADEADLERVADRIRDDRRPVDILVSNAGFGLEASFDESSIDDERRLLHLLSAVPMRLMHAAIPGMRDRGRGWIVNVASMAAFMPTGTYAAAKAHLVTLSRSASMRHRADGIRVTALCPGFVRTEFHDRMGATPPLPDLLWCSARDVVRDGLRAVRRGQAVCVADWRYRLMLPVARVVPDRFVHRISGPRLAELGAGLRRR